MPLTDVLHEVAARIERHRGQAIGEQNTKATLIDPVLRALGWDTESLDDVQREWRRVPRDKPVDYALLLQREPSVFVEAKGLSEDLNDRRWATQVVNYANTAGVNWVALTNGDEYRIYNAHAPVAIDDKLFRQVSVSGDPDAAAGALGLLGRNAVRERSLETLWRTEEADRLVREAFLRMLRPEPSPWLIRRLDQAIPDLKARDIKASLARAEIALDFPSPTAAVEPAIPPPPQRRPSPSTASVSLADLVAAGLLVPGVVLSNLYKGVTLSAQVDETGRVRFEGETFASPSAAAGAARKRVNGPHPTRPEWSTNGWIFWTVRDADGRRVTLDVLRARYRAPG